MSAIENKGQITFKYVFEDSYNPKYVNGAIGGLSAKNEIIMNFYLERPPVPKKMIHEIEDGALSDPRFEPSDHESNYIRFIQDGIILSYDSAIQIKDWLESRIEELEQRAKDQS